GAAGEESQFVLPLLLAALLLAEADVLQHDGQGTCERLQKTSIIAQKRNGAGARLERKPAFRRAASLERSEQTLLRCCGCIGSEPYLGGRFKDSSEALGGLCSQVIFIGRDLYRRDENTLGFGRRIGAVQPNTVDGIGQAAIDPRREQPEWREQKREDP